MHSPRPTMIFGHVLLAVAALAPPALAADPPPARFEPMAQDTIVPAGSKLEAVWSAGEFTESPVATADGAILFSDIGDRILRFDPASGSVSEFRSPSGKSNGLVFNAGGQLIACEGAGPGGNRRISITDAQGTVRVLADHYQGKRFNSPNDLDVTRSGAVYFSDPRYVGDEPRELDFEAVFLVEPGGAVRIATRDVQKPNGILVTPDGKTVYVSDNNNRPEGHHQLVAFRVRADGTLDDKGVLFDFGPNRRGIDGMTLDAEGNIYAAAGRGGEAGIYVFSGNGAPLAFVPMPGDPTNCAFGVGDQSQVLYITAASRPGQPDGARPPYALFRIRLAKAGYQLFPPAAK